MRAVRMLVAGVAAGAVSLGAGTAAVAAPTGGDAGTLTCEGGIETSFAVAPGNGNWTPAFPGTSHTFVPTAFNGFHGTVYDAEGNVVDEFDDPSGSVKGRGARDAKADVVSCSFTFTELSDGSDPEFPVGYSFVGTGGVRGFFR
jgi:hypothetical protein